MHNHTGDAQSYQCPVNPKLNGRLASLSRFLPKLAKKMKPFYKLFKKTEPFLWNYACEQAFKKTIATLLVLSHISQ